ncbi:MAG: AraC family transcriptional regulator [Hyphomicrobiales bacterium]
MKAQTRINYGERIERATRYIVENLDKDMDLASLAGIACLSPFHFHRIYRAVTGETVIDTVRRNRLHLAAGELITGDAPLADIARRARYASVQAFTRAFNAAYGIAPATYRKARMLDAPHQSRNAPKETAMYDVEIRTIEPISLAAIRHVGPYMEIGKAFERLFPWAFRQGLANSKTRMIAVYYDDPKSVPAAGLRSDAAISVTKAVPADDTVRPLEVAGGRYAVTIHKGPYAELERAYNWLYREWLPTSGEEPADRPCFEEYLNDPRATPPAELLTAVALPLKD